MSGAAPWHVGTQSWFYPEWKGVFYDEEARTEDFLEMYAQEFLCVEVDTSFYGTPTEATLERWLDATPPDFVFLPKAPREITHERAFRDAEAPFDAFCERMVALGEQLGPVLVQTPPALDAAALPALLALLARRPEGMRMAVEFRNESWFRPATFDGLERLGVAVAAVDGPFMPPRYARRIVERPTADFRYVRLLGVRGAVERFDRRVFDRGEDLAAWRELLDRDAAVDRFVTVSNYFEGFAAETARRLLAAAGVPHEAREIERPLGLFDEDGP